MKRLYVITRADLSSGMRVAQSCHAALGSGFSGQEQPFLIVLQVPGELALKELFELVDS